jgi:hypothetical protein
MKKLLWAVVIVCISLIGVSQSEAIKSIVGVSSECDSTNTGCIPIPLANTTICSAGCTTLTAKSFTDANRFWGGTSSCRTSTDGGATWGNCTTQPLSSGAQENYAEASDGSVIAIGQVTTTCTVKRSTDQGANWTTVYTAASTAIACGGAVTGGYRLICLSDARCTFSTVHGTTSVPIALESTDNGQTWVPTTYGAVATSFVSMAWDGSAGIATSNGLRSGKYAAGWSQGAAAFASCGTISGSVVYNGVGYGLCKDTGTNEIYRMMTADGALFKAITLPGVYQSSGVGILAYSVGTNTLHVVANVAVTAGSLPIGVWVSRDDGVTFTKVYTSPQTVNSMGSQSSIFYTNGCVYYSGGVGTVFNKVC